MNAESPAEGARYQDLNRRLEADRTLRPRSLDDFIGQERVRANLRVAIEAARKRGESLDHLLLSGLPGLGKTSMAHVVAAEMGVQMHATSGPALERAGDLVSMLTSLRKGDVVFIDEVHRLPRVVEEYLYSAMEDFKVDLVIDQGPAARSISVTLEPFTLIGATTREGLLTAPFRSRFGLLEKLDPYPVDDLVRILTRSAALLDMSIAPDALTLIAQRARGTPRVANRLLRRVRDLAEVRGERRIEPALATETLRNIGIDDAGLEQTDRRILQCLHRAGGGPVGLKTLAAAVGEEEDTLEAVYEPYLLALGFLVRTPRGRVLTERGRIHLLGRDGSFHQESLFS